MKVQIEQFEDKDESDEDGFYEYYYKGKHLVFEEDNTTVNVRTYDENPNEANFMALNGGLFDAKTIHHPMLKQVEDYLRKIGYHKFKILFRKGYVDYPVSGPRS